MVLLSRPEAYLVMCLSQWVFDNAMFESLGLDNAMKLPSAN